MAVIDLDSSLGSLFIGVVVGAALWGVTCTQVWTYFFSAAARDDPWPIRGVVAFAWTTDTVHQILITHLLYLYLVTNYGNPLFLFHVVVTLQVEIPIQELTSFSVQCYYAYRIWRLSDGNVWLTGSVIALVLAQFGVAIAFTVGAFQNDTFLKLQQHMGPLVLAFSTLALAADLLVAGAMCMLLRRGRSGLARTDTMINKLVTFTLTTGVLTCICALGGFIARLAGPDTITYIPFFFIIGRFYVNSLISSLNMRATLRAGKSSFATTSLSNASSGLSSRAAAFGAGAIGSAGHSAGGAYPGAYAGGYNIGYVGGYDAAQGGYDGALEPGVLLIGRKRSRSVGSELGAAPPLRVAGRDHNGAEAIGLEHPRYGGWRDRERIRWEDSDPGV